MTRSGDASRCETHGFRGKGGWWGLGDAEQVDHEDQSLARELVTASRGTVCEVRRDRELAASADLHTRNAFLPTPNEALKRKLDRLATVPGRVELVAGLKLHTEVVDLDRCAWLGFSAIADNDVEDLEVDGRFAAGELNFRLVSHNLILPAGFAMHRTWVTIWFMRATVLHSPRDIRLDDVAAPQLFDDTDAIVRVVASCICGSDLWPYRGINAVPEPKHIGHEFIGIVESVGSAVATVTPGQFVIAPFNASDNTCSVCERGMQASCKNFTAWGANDSNGNFVQGGQGEFVRVPFADGTLVATPSEPDAAMIPHLLTLSDVFPTGHHAAVAAGVTPGSTVAVVGDGAVGLSAVLAAKRLGATTIVAMSRHETRQNVARTFGATHIVSARGKEGAKEVREILDGMGADFVLECVGTNDS
ncbi:MAG: dehydrogenase, partial [Nocardioidaceae bacterium]|nr:dehydrogenase [Nocardioidaceae bacterium]